MNYKNNKGVTLIALIITIIVLIILSSIATTQGLKTMKAGKAETTIGEVLMVSQAVLEQYTKYVITDKDDYLCGRKMTYAEVQEIVDEMNRKTQEKNNENNTDYKLVNLKMQNYDSNLFTPNEQYYYRLSENDLVILGIKNTAYTFIVNYKTGEVINETELNTTYGEALYTSGVS